MEISFSAVRSIILEYFSRAELKRTNRESRSKKERVTTLKLKKMINKLKEINKAKSKLCFFTGGKKLRKVSNHLHNRRPKHVGKSNISTGRTQLSCLHTLFSFTAAQSAISACTFACLLTRYAFSDYISSASCQCVTKNRSRIFPPPQAIFSHFFE